MGFKIDSGQKNRDELRPALSRPGTRPVKDGSWALSKNLGRWDGFFLLVFIEI